MMYGTQTQTQTFTMTNARRVTAKIAADLDLMRSHYGRPSEADVTAFAEEAAMLLAKRYLGTVEFGFKKDDKVILSLKYQARSDGTLATDDRPGRVPADVDVSKAVFYSWLTYSAAWGQLSASERSTFESTLPVQRTSGTAPTTVLGYWTSDRSYSSNGEGVARQTFRAA